MNIPADAGQHPKWLVTMYKIFTAAALILKLKGGTTNIEWRPQALHRELVPIASLESGYGANQAHKPSMRGEYFSAYGPVGLKASTAHMEYMRNKSLRDKYPGLEDSTKFTFEFSMNANVYYDCANTHWRWLRSHTDSMIESVYAWRWGFGALQKSDGVNILSDEYVERYMLINHGVTVDIR